MGSFGSRNERGGITSRFRLRGYDYSLRGYYFVTICVQDRLHRFGSVNDGIFVPSSAGEMVASVWGEQSLRFSGIEFDAFCVMPNHFHALLGLSVRDEVGHPDVSLPSVIQGFKSATTVAYGRGVKTLGWPAYDRRLWQKGYHDHIARSEREIERIQDYIRANAAMWERDTFFS